MPILYPKDKVKVCLINDRNLLPVQAAFGELAPRLGGTQRDETGFRSVSKLTLATSTLWRGPPKWLEMYLVSFPFPTK